jgi:hypothetical protein
MQAFPKSRWSKQSMSSVKRDLHPLTGDCVNGGTRSTKRKYLDTRYSTKWGEDSIYCSQFENLAILSGTIIVDTDWQQHFTCHNNYQDTCSPTRNIYCSLHKQCILIVISHSLTLPFYCPYLWYHSFVTGWWVFPVSSTNKTDYHDITEILLEVALNSTDQKSIQ